MAELPKATVQTVISSQDSVMLPRTLTPEIVDILNSAIAEEYTAHYFYRGAANWCQGVGYTKAAEFYTKEAAAELEHAEKLQKYIIDWNATPLLPAIKFNGNFAHLIDVVNKSYAIEYQLGDKYMTWTRQMFDTHLMTFNFLQTFVDLQNDSIAEMSDLLNAAQLVDVSNKLDLLHFEERYFG
jgi:ferritin